MAAPDVTSFKARFPEFGSGVDARITFYLADVVAELSKPAWGTVPIWAKACETLAAHRLALSQQRTAEAQVTDGGQVVIAQQGTIQNASADGLSVGFAGKQSQTAGTVAEEEYSQTPYGIQYMTMRARFLRRGRLASVGNSNA